MSLRYIYHFVRSLAAYSGKIFLRNCCAHCIVGSVNQGNFLHKAVGALRAGQMCAALSKSFEQSFTHVFIILNGRFYYGKCSKTRKRLIAMDSQEYFVLIFRFGTHFLKSTHSFTFSLRFCNFWSILTHAHSLFRNMLYEFTVQTFDSLVGVKKTDNSL